MNRFQGKQFIIRVSIVLKRHYPGFNDLLDQIPDHRSRSTYQVAEVIMAGLSMFIFKRGSRHHADCSVKGHFSDNYMHLFGLRLPIMDTVHKFLEKLPAEELENIKKVLVQKLFEKKVLEKWKFMGRYQVAVDGTGVYSFDYEPFEGCPHKTSKNGKKTWQVHVLEAKIVMTNGLSLSIATEWLYNSENLDEKQDCELKAFVRLAKKIKQVYPRLPIILCADGLYPNVTVFKLCKQFGWKFIITFKDGSLPSVWEEVGLLYPLEAHHNKQERLLKGSTKESTMFINNIEYKGHSLHWIEYREYEEDATPQKRFAHITDIKPDVRSVWDISRHARIRWRIENEGFNTQKNQGYGLQHKYARKNFTAMKNYYQLLQIAHLINQLTEKLQKVKQAIEQACTTLKALWEDMMASMQKEVFCPNHLAEEIDKCRQLRY